MKSETQHTNSSRTDQIPRWVTSLDRIPPDRKPAQYEVKCADGALKIVTLKDRKRQVVDALLLGPLYCASTVRLGDAVFRLKEDHNLHALTLATAEGRKFYTLHGQGVRKVDGGAA